VLWVRALCPLTLAGLVIGTILAGLTKEHAMLGRRQLFCLVAVCGGFAVSAVSAIRSSGLNEALQGLADGTSYIFMIFIVAAHFRTAEELVRFMKQQFFGLSDFEIEYLRSGLTILSKHLLDVRPRPFSTLTDCSPYGTTCALLACFALAIWQFFLQRNERQWRVAALIAWALFVAGCVTSMSRMSNANWILPVLLLPLLRSRAGTFSVYAGIAGGFTLACVFAMQLKTVIERATLRALDLFGSSSLGEQFARFWTLGDRLDGMHQLATNPKMWVMFGYGPKLAREMINAGEVHSHDVVSTTLLEIGWLPSLVLLVILGVFVLKVHQSIFALRGRIEFNLCLWLVATAIGLLFHNVFAGGVTSTFPVNLFFWFMVGGIVSLVGTREPATLPEEELSALSITPFRRDRATGFRHPAHGRA
jgi:hypothetical protein